MALIIIIMIRTLLCRPLPVDVGRCVCYITRERKDGINGYALYTDVIIINNNPLALR